MKKILNYVIAIAGVILCAAGLVMIKKVDLSDGIMKTLPYIMVGLGCGAFGQGAGSILSNKLTNTDKEFAHKMEIEKNDERNVSIGNKAKSKAFDMMIYVFGALLLAYCLMGAEMKIILPFACAYILTDVYAVYNRIKLDKEM